MEGSDRGPFQCSIPTRILVSGLDSNRIAPEETLVELPLFLCLEFYLLSRERRLWHVCANYSLAHISSFGLLLYFPILSSKFPCDVTGFLPCGVFKRCKLCVKRKPLCSGVKNSERKPIYRIPCSRKFLAIPC